MHERKLAVFPFRLFRKEGCRCPNTRYPRISKLNAPLPTKVGAAKNHFDTHKNWEVLDGVGVDGVRSDFPLFLRMFPLFYRMFPLFLRIFPLFLRFSLLLLKDKGKQQQFTEKMGISLRPRLHRPRAKLPEKGVANSN